MKKIWILGILFGCMLVSCNSAKSSGKSNSFIKVFDEEHLFFMSHMEKVIKENETTASLAGQLIAEMKSQPRYSKKIYFINKTGVLADHDHHAKSNIYINADTVINDDTWKMIQLTEALEDRWKDVFEKYPSIGWQYITEGSTKVTRTYPWLDEVKYIGPYTDYTKTLQWDLVNPETNPSGETRCSQIYYDHDGLGYMITCVAPVVANGNFRGTMSIDLTISKYFAPIQDKINLDNNKCSYFTDLKGNVIAQTDNANKVVSCKRLLKRNVIEKDSVFYRFISGGNNCEAHRAYEISYEEKKLNVLCKQIPYINGYHILVYKNNS
ncbi:hypothetical protein KKA47_00135 [bacterium]|nr:hypothetical protein [bacterium]